MMNSVQAIIVVGPILWKCVHCNLLFSRRHSIDYHLNSSHLPDGAHETSVLKKCKVSCCSCKSLPVMSKRNKNRKKVRQNGSKNDGLLSQKNLDDEHMKDKSDNPDDSFDDPEVMEALRIRVEEASKEKEMNEVKGNPFNSDYPSTLLETKEGHDGSKEKTKGSFTDDDIVNFVDYDQTNNHGVLASETSTLSNINLTRSSDTKARIRKKKQTLTSCPTSETATCPLRETKSVKRKPSLNSSSNDESSRPQNKARKSSTKSKESMKESQRLSTKSLHDLSRRMSSRANKGKNESLRTDFKVEIA